MGVALAAGALSCLAGRAQAITVHIDAGEDFGACYDVCYKGSQSATVDFDTKAGDASYYIQQVGISFDEYGNSFLGTYIHNSLGYPQSIQFNDFGFGYYTFELDGLAEYEDEFGQYSTVD